MKVFLMAVLCWGMMLFSNLVFSQTIIPTFANPLNIDTTFLGNFTDDYKIRYTISPTTFIQHPGVKYNILSYNKKEEYIIAQNDSGNISDAILFTRIDLIRFSNMEPWHWGFCLTAYQAPNMKAALNTSPPDRENPKKGCGGYPFSRMKRVN
jgi:hypothetical protein